MLAALQDHRARHQALSEPLGPEYVTAILSSEWPLACVIREIEMRLDEEKAKDFQA